MTDPMFVKRQRDLRFLSSRRKIITGPMFAKRHYRALAGAVHRARKLIGAESAPISPFDYLCQEIENLLAHCGSDFDLARYRRAIKTGKECDQWAAPRKGA